MPPAAAWPRIHPTPCPEPARAPRRALVIGPGRGPGRLGRGTQPGTRPWTRPAGTTGGRPNWAPEMPLGSLPKWAAAPWRRATESRQTQRRSIGKHPRPTLFQEAPARHRPGVAHERPPV
eukprot:scaffold3074_cov92-Isochrysis_galbana.AAC.2